MSRVFSCGNKQTVSQSSIAMPPKCTSDRVLIQVKVLSGQKGLGETKLFLTLHCPLYVRCLWNHKKLFKIPPNLISRIYFKHTLFNVASVGAIHHKSLSIAVECECVYVMKQTQCMLPPYQHITLLDCTQFVFRDKCSLSFIVLLKLRVGCTEMHKWIEGYKIMRRLLSIQ